MTVYTDVSEEPTYHDVVTEETAYCDVLCEELTDHDVVSEELTYLFVYFHRNVFILECFLVSHTCAFFSHVFGMHKCFTLYISILKY